MPLKSPLNPQKMRMELPPTTSNNKVKRTLSRCEKLRFLWKFIRRRFRILAPPKAAQSCQKKSGAAEGVKIIEEKSLPPQKAGESLKKQETRLGAAEGSTNVEKSSTPPKTVKHCWFFFSASGFVWWRNQVWRLLHSEEFRFGVVRL